MDSRLSFVQPEVSRVVEHLKVELSGVRTGRANAGLVAGVSVEAYGAVQPLKNVASVSVSDPQTLRIEAWDATLTEAIEKALRESSIGIMPTVDGKVIRLSIPSMTEETRKELIKVVGKKAEEARIAVRSVREDARKRIEKMEKEKSITEDDRFSFQEELDETISAANKQIESLAKEKESQVLTV